MSDEYMHWKLGGDGRWIRHHLDEDGAPLHRPAGRPHRDARQAAPQGPPAVTRPHRGGHDVRIPAAGTLPWRLRDGALEVALVHRPRYDDWSWAKGKLDPGEDWAVAAVRETEEETGLVVRLGPPLPEARYTLLGRDGTPDDKVVRYWSARVTGGDGHLLNEIDEVVWLDVAERARPARLRPRPRPAARPGAAAADRAARHLAARARAPRPRGRPRRLARATTPPRPLDDLGRARAAALERRCSPPTASPAWSPRPPSAACAPSSRMPSSAGVRLRTRRGLSEEGFEAAPDKAHRHLRRLLERGEPAAAVHPRAGAARAARRPRAAARPRRRRLGRGGRGVRRRPATRSWPRARPWSATSSAPARPPGRRGGAPPPLTAAPAAASPGALSRTPLRPDRPDHECPDAVHGAFTRRGPIASPGIHTFTRVGQRRPPP